MSISCNGDSLVRLPSWLRKPHVPDSRIHSVKSILRRRRLNTVCESARCPNIGECFSRPTATFLILGKVCTRRCGFCDVEKGGRPLPLYETEPVNIAVTVKELSLRHVVVTSVTRDDLTDGGSGHFAKTVKAIRKESPATMVEVLIPDFKGREKSLDTVLDSNPDILNHNIETVPSLYPLVRPGADYIRSLNIISRVKERGITAKSGIMLGFGEKRDEVLQVMDDLASKGCDALTIGQYLRPSKRSLPVREYIHPSLFKVFREDALRAGFRYVSSGPFVRSSYNAESQLTIDGYVSG